jgi:hypothetical protein
MLILSVAVHAPCNSIEHLLLLLQVVVRSLQEAGKTSLLNNNITVVTPAPPAVQAEASGQQYGQGKCYNVCCRVEHAIITQ